MIRKLIYFDYYEKADPEWASVLLMREHAGRPYHLNIGGWNGTDLNLLSGHCVDMLRDALMCSADTGLITYHWIKGYSSPMQDFSTLVSYDTQIPQVHALTFHSTLTGTQRRSYNGQGNMKFMSMRRL